MTPLNLETVLVSSIVSLIVSLAAMLGKYYLDDLKEKRSNVREISNKLSLKRIENREDAVAQVLALAYRIRNFVRDALMHPGDLSQNLVSETEDLYNTYNELIYNNYSALRQIETLWPHIHNYKKTLNTIVNLQALLDGTAVDEVILEDYEESKRDMLMIFTKIESAGQALLDHQP